MTTGTGGDFLNALSPATGYGGCRGTQLRSHERGRASSAGGAARQDLPARRGGDYLRWLFFAATDSTQADSLADFGRLLAGLGEAGSGGRYEFADWDEALRRLFETAAEGVIVIDEFPYLMKASPALPSLIQRALGPRGYAQQSRARLLLSGSAMPVMGNLLSGSAPLRGRASLEMIIRVLSLGEAKWDKVMSARHLQRLRRARDLLAVKGYDVGGTKLACYSGAGFDPELVDLADDDPAILLVGLEMLYA